MSELPNGWIETTLGKEDIDILTGFAFKSQNFKLNKIDDSYLPVLKIKNVANGDTNHNEVVFHKLNDRVEKYIIQKNDILIALTGNHPFAKTQVVGGISKYRLKEKSLLNQRIAKLKTKNNKLHTEFIYFFFKWSETKFYIGNQSKGSANQANISKVDILNTPLKLPKIEEQKAIANILSSFDNKIELLKEQNKTLETMAQTIFKEWFVDFNYPNATGEMIDSEIGDIPKGWRVGKVKDIVNVFDSQRIPLSSREREKRQGIYPYHGATKIMDYIDDYIFDGTYLLFAEDGSVIDDNGHPFLQYVWDKFWVNNHTHILQGKNGFSTELLYVLFKKSKVSSIVNGAVQLKINQTNLMNFRAVIPTSNVLDRLNEVIKPIFKKIKINTNQIQTLQKTRDTLLPKLMSGDLRVKYDKIKHKDKQC